MRPDPKAIPAKTDSSDTVFDNDICNIRKNFELISIIDKNDVYTADYMDNDSENYSIHPEHCCDGGDVDISTDPMNRGDFGYEYYPQGEVPYYNNNCIDYHDWTVGHECEYYPQGYNYVYGLCGYNGLVDNRNDGYEHYPYCGPYNYRDIMYDHMFTDHVMQIHNIGNYFNFNTPAIRIYNNTGNLFHIATSQVDFNMYQDPDFQRQLSNMTSVKHDQVTMSFTNHGKWFKGKWATLVYLQEGSNPGMDCYLFVDSQGGQYGSLIPHASPIAGFLQITHKIELRILSYDQQVTGQGEEYNNPKLVYDNYCQDIRSHKYYGCTYVDYMLNIIDLMLTDMNPDYDTCSTSKPDKVSFDIVTTTTYDRIHLPDSIPVSDYGISCTTPGLNKVMPIDFNYSGKTVGYLNQAPTDFSFIGPDRAPIQITSVDKLLEVADVILSTGVPNYHMTKIPIQSGLNVEAWEHHLRDYADKRVTQYIKFGYPLSLKNAHKLCNKEVTNHFSARQYPTQVQDYIDKESKLGALLGPVNNIDHYHCSPLLTRPKDTDKRRVILNLSYPYGQSVNDHVHKEEYDSNPFILKFPTIDDIVRDIKNAEGDTILFKVDVACAFRNLRVDPADDLKLGISWGGRVLCGSCDRVRLDARLRIVSDFIRCHCLYHG